MKSLDILIVDDDRDLAESIGEALELAGHNPTIAHSGTEAIEKYCGAAFDITFMDVKLPDINGVETFRTIREMNSNARVVMMTGYRVNQLLAEAMSHGAVKVMRKPFAMEEILTTLSDAEPSGMILVADDDPEFAQSVTQMLDDHGYRSVVARTGAEAVEKAIESDCDVLILDLRLPILHGLDVYLELERRGKIIPTIIVTGFGRDEESAIDTLRSLSVMGCLLKPFEPTHLLKAVDAIARSEKPEL